jgi:hypothetical protein
MTLWLYRLSDRGGSWPVLRDEPLPPGDRLCEGEIEVVSLGSFPDAERAWAAFHALEDHHPSESP